jgi:hypothetical protein
MNPAAPDHNRALSVIINIRKVGTYNESNYDQLVIINKRIAIGGDKNKAEQMFENKIITSLAT